jgi:glycosyltransferase involved in cell wall biosynthesis
MLQGKKVIVVLPAYNAGKTLERTVAAIPRECVDDIVLVDDASRDATVDVARSLGLGVLVHPRNSGYGANQKTCYRAALDRGADIVVMLHPDYQYDPRLITAMAGMVASGIYGIVLGSRILGSGSAGALAGGMPWWKYVANRALTAFQNLLTGAKLSEYHTGYRAYSAGALRRIPFLANSDDFVFDNQLLVQALAANVAIGEISCPTRYEPESSSISFARSVRYGLGVVGTTLAYRAWRWKLSTPRFLAFSSGDFVGSPARGAEDPVARH